MSVQEREELVLLTYIVKNTLIKEVLMEEMAVEVGT
jgi:hypothetical protein